MPKVAPSVGALDGTPAPEHANIVPLSFAATQNSGTGSPFGSKTHCALDDASPIASIARTTPDSPTIANQLPEPTPHALVSVEPADIRRKIPHVRTSVSTTVPSSPTEHNTRPPSIKLVDPTMALGCAVTSATRSPNVPLEPSPYTRTTPSEHPHASTPSPRAMENKYPGDQRSGVRAPDVPKSSLGAVFAVVVGVFRRAPRVEDKEKSPLSFVARRHPPYGAVV